MTQLDFTPDSETDQITSTAFKRKIELLLDKYRIPGCSISVVRKEEGKWKQGVTSYGIRNVAKEPRTKDSKHLIASCSKVFAALSVAILIDRGTLLPNGAKLNWNTKVKDVLPDWRLMDKDTEANADIEDVLSMQLGIPVNNAAWGQPGETAAAIVERMRYNKPAAPLRKACIYSNESYALAGEFIAKLAGEPYDVFVKANILDPLGMSESTYDRSAALDSGERVEGFIHYDRDLEALKEGKWNEAFIGQVGQTTFWNEGDGMFMAAYGGLWSTGNDILKFLKELLEPTILPHSAIAEINRPRIAWGPVDQPHPALSMMYYNIGQYTVYYRGHQVVGHSGGVPGHYSLILRLPADNIGLAIFINDQTFGPDVLMAISMLLIDELLDVEERVDWEEIYISESMKEPVTKPQRPPNPRPSPEISGLYHHGTYGNLTVRTLNNHPMCSIFTKLLDEDPGNAIYIQPGVIPYICDLPHDLRGKLLLIPYDGPIFKRVFMKAEKVKPLNLRDKREHAGSLWLAGKCVAVESGIGMFEDFWGQGGAVSGLSVRQCTEVDVEHTSEVWFAKIT